MDFDCSQHYLFAHRALPQWFHRDPSAFLEALLSEEGTLGEWWEHVGQSFEDREAYVATNGLTAEFHRVGSDMVVALIKLPAPLRAPEAYFVAAVCEFKEESGVDQIKRGVSLVQQRFVTLECSRLESDDVGPEAKGILDEISARLGGSPFAASTKLGEWTRDGYHLTYGPQGPKPEPRAFLGAVVALISGQPPFNEPPVSSSGPAWNTSDPEVLNANQRQYEALEVPAYLRPIWPAWSADIDVPGGEFLAAAQQCLSLTELWDRCRRPDWLLWLWAQALEFGMAGELPEAKLRLFACWCIRRGLDTMRERPGNDQALAQLYPVVESAERDAIGQGTRADVRAVLPEANVYFRTAECEPEPEPNGHSYAYWACHELTTDSAVATAMKASEFAAWFTAYASLERPISQEEYGDDVHPRAWYPVAAAEYAVAAAKLRQMLGNPFSSEP